MNAITMRRMKMVDDNCFVPFSRVRIEPVADMCVNANFVCWSSDDAFPRDVSIECALVGRRRSCFRISLGDTFGKLFLQGSAMSRISWQSSLCT